MASLRQIAANRLNATRSTGPASDEGKAVSRRNALTHGLSGAGVVLPDEEEGAVADRLERWRGGYAVASPEDEWQYRQLVTESVRVDRCQAHETALRTHAALRANLSWDDDRRLDAEALMAGLARKPALVSLKLQRTRQGCDALLERWRGLGQVLELKGEWTDAQRSLAFDLLGTAADLRGEFPWSDLAGSAAELVVLEVARLEALQAEALDELDEVERESACLGLETDPSRALGLLRRYESACLRRFQQARKHLLSTRPAVPALAPAPAPVPVVPPPPPPPPAPEMPLRPVAPRPAPLIPAPPRPAGNRQARRAAEKAARRREVTGRVSCPGVKASVS